eukprot:Colp12_sorted_trinity150504_noHs@14091
MRAYVQPPDIGLPCIRSYQAPFSHQNVFGIKTASNGLGMQGALEWESNDKIQPQRPRAEAKKVDFIKLNRMCMDSGANKQKEYQTFRKSHRPALVAVYRRTHAKAFHEEEPERFLGICTKPTHDMKAIMAHAYLQAPKLQQRKKKQTQMHTVSHVLETTTRIVSDKGGKDPLSRSLNKKVCSKGKLENSKLPTI